MEASFGDIKKICKEQGYACRAGLFGVSRNDSGKFDFIIDTKTARYAVKAFVLPKDAQRMYFRLAGQYITVKCASGEVDYSWNAPKELENADKKTLCVLVTDREVAMTEIGKNKATTVTQGAHAFGQTVYSLPAFLKLLAK